MADAAIDPPDFSESRRFSEVLNLYVADNVTNFVAAAFSLLGADQLCDFSVALLCKQASGSFVAHNSDQRAWSSSFVQRQAALLRSIRSEVGAERKVLITQTTAESPARESLQRYNEDILQKIGSSHGVLLFFGDHADPLSLLISVHRIPGSPDFTQSELSRLEAFRHQIETAWSLLTQRLLTRVLLEGISLALRNYHLGTVMLDSRLQVVGHNRAARECILSWENDHIKKPKLRPQFGPLPADILQACERLRAEWMEFPSLGCLRRSHLIPHPTTPAHCARVRLYGVHLTGIALPSFIVQFEAPPAGAGSSTSSIMDTLTSAEREVAQLVRQGMSNQEIADALGKSVDAVKFHLHRMFKKAQVTTRSRLMLALT